MRTRRTAFLRAAAVAAVLGLTGFGFGAPALATSTAAGDVDGSASAGVNGSDTDAADGDGSDAADGNADTDPKGERPVDDAVFDWSINDEATGGAYFGGCNFLAAGKAGDAGASRQWTSDDAGMLYHVDPGGNFVDGDVSIVKTNNDLTKWNTRCETADGESVNTKTNAQADDDFTGDRVRITNGTGTVDPETNSATIQWKGSWTFAFYGGLTYWTITDPKLEVKNGQGTVTGTYSGYGASREDSSKWVPLDPRNGTIIELKKSKVDVTDEGFKFTPDYLGVTGEGRNPQAEKTTANESWWGAMPKDWVDFNVETGQDSFWYTTDGGPGTIQPRKTTNPLTVAYKTKTEEPTDSKKAGDDGSKDGGGSDADGSNGGAEGGGDGGKTPTPTGDGSATLYWSLNQEANAGAYYGGCNFLSAGTAKNVGGAKVWTEADGAYSAKSGNVTIEKPKGKTFKQATFAERCLDATGEQVETTRKGSWTQSRVALRKGVVTADESGVTVQWSGSFTVVFYGGMTYWSASDPKLVVGNDGKGTLTATVSGYGSDRFDTSKWVELGTSTVTMANFSDVDIAALTDKGYFTATPDYLGVSYDSEGKSGSAAVAGGDENASGQAKKDSGNAAFWGSFPQDFVDFQHKTGQYSYWFTSGGQRDPYKPAEPVTVALGDYSPEAGDYEAAPGAGQPQQGGGSGPAQNAPGGAVGPSQAAKKKPEATTTSASDVDDGTVFAQQAEEQRAASEVPVRVWIALGTGLAVATVAGFGIRSGIRRSIGLDPRDLL